MIATGRNNRRGQQYIICTQLGTNVRKRFLAEYKMLMFLDGTCVVCRVTTEICYCFHVKTTSFCSIESC